MDYLRVTKHNHLERFIARRLYGQDDGSKGGSRPAIIIATAGIALGIAVMIITIAVTRGFKGEIREKLMGFTQHIQVTNSFTGMGMVENPVTFSDAAIDSLAGLDGIDYVQPYVTKPCIVRTGEAFHGFMLKGIGESYDRTFLNSYMVDGGLPEPGDTIGPWILLSTDIADMLGVSVGDKADVHFMQDRIRMRRVTVCGTFKTGFADYDRMMGISDLGMLQKLNGWDNDQFTGLEVRLDDPDELYEGYMQIRQGADSHAELTGEDYLIRTMEDLNAGLFAWLGVLDMNVWIILALMMGIAGFTMISGLLIIIFERASTIGTLKSLGASDKTVRKIFLRLASYIIVRGMVIGNIIGIGLCLIQKWFRIIPLDPANYYLDSVPMQVGPVWLVVLNLVMFGLSMLMMLIPAGVISRITPAQSMRFE